MKVALVHDYLIEYGGAEKVLEVLHEMYPEAPVYTSFYFPDKMPAFCREWDVRVSGLHKIPMHRLFRKPLIYAMPWAFEQFDLRGYDLVISSSSFAAKGVITHSGTTHICYCHTPPRFVWGLPSRVRRNYLMKLLLGVFDARLRLWDFAAASRVDKFVANSKLVARRIKKFYEKDSVVVYPPINGCSQVSDSQLSDGTSEKLRGSEYYLVVSRLVRLKNIDVIIRACLRQRRKLKIVGKGDDEKYFKSISDESIEFLGFVEEEVLMRLYSGAMGLIVAAEDEDFGMTPAEAHMCGCPVLAFRGGGYIETVIDRINGLFFDSLDQDCIGTAIRKFEEIVFDRERIRRDAIKFSKERFMRDIRKVVGEQDNVR